MNEYIETLPCGGRALPDSTSGTGARRCDGCFCVIGSMGMPRSCYEAWAQQPSRATHPDPTP